MNTTTDSNGLIWTRSSDRLTMTCEDGRVIICTADMTDDYLVGLSSFQSVESKSDAERIAELEAQLAALLARLS